ncbi:MAG: VWA domain-containing protein [Acidimicrobiales bacterium]|jgi:uncharacterized protein with von Willebrand factor type A (vWA) domain|nr:VWA domain-containing protein [Acidimicrobiales bacterium]|tara:strand:+ start:1918 stop:3054 length:1137 start_codon:yes stop_codon:yes gene_type:complete
MSDESEEVLCNGSAEIAVAFCRILRGAGLEVPISKVTTFVEALGRVGLEEKLPVYWAARCTLLSNPGEVDAFNRAFEVFWERKALSRLEIAVPSVSVSLATDAGEDDSEINGDNDGNAGPIIQLRYSPVETLREKDFAECTAAELNELRKLMGSLRLGSTTRASRRRVRSKHQTQIPDMRRTIRRAVSLGGEPIERKFLRRDRRPRRLILLVDVSGSMEPYARALIRFAHATVVGRTRVEAFAIGTRLTRVTRELSSLDPDAALDAASDAVSDWSGGTRLGSTIRDFNDQWGIRGMARGAIVVILSDGWDRGDPQILSEQMERLHRVSFRQIWVNPLKHTPGYAPLAKGMAAALPHTDQFIEGHSFESLERLAEAVTA